MWECMCVCVYECVCVCVCERHRGHSHPSLPPNTVLRLRPEAQGQPSHPSQGPLSPPSPTLRGARARARACSRGLRPLRLEERWPSSLRVLLSWAHSEASQRFYFFPLDFLLCFLSSDLKLLTINLIQAVMPPGPLRSKLHSLELSPAHSQKPKGAQGPGVGPAPSQACAARLGAQPLGECDGSGIREGLGGARWWLRPGGGGTACEENLFTEQALGTRYSGNSAAQGPSRKSKIRGSLPCAGVIFGQHGQAARARGSTRSRTTLCCLVLSKRVTRSRAAQCASLCKRPWNESQP